MAQLLAWLPNVIEIYMYSIRFSLKVTFKTDESMLFMQARLTDATVKLI